MHLSRLGERTPIVTGSKREGPPADSNPQPVGEKLEPGDHAKAKAKEMAKAYEQRPTAVLPDSNRTVTGTAVNDWLDGDGNPIYGNDNKTRRDDQT